ncbi:MAG TPA: excisionase family protein [Methylotenera sp.]|nr:excisionase family protein [Methylotenera sp.]HPH04301.1 excisionase family protein [Methylotenera sp.]HPM99855.1 excisionase family protein [Methylotenera sp.]
MKWVLINKVIELIGYTDDAIRAKIKKGVWLSGIHWRKAPDGRLMFNLEAIQKWIEGKA